MTLSLGSTTVSLIATTTNAALATGTNDQFLLLKAIATNTSTGTAFVTVWRVPQGMSVGSGNAVIESVEVPGNRTKVLPLSGETLVNGDALYASATVANVINLAIGYASL